MPIIVKCPSCRVSLRIPSKVVRRGKEIHCPRCKSPVSPFEAIAYNPEPAPPADTTPRPAPANHAEPPAVDDPFDDLVPLEPAEEKRANERSSSPRPHAPQKNPRSKRDPDQKASKPRAVNRPPPTRAERRSKAVSAPPEAEEVIDVLEEAAAAADGAKSTRVVHRQNHDEEGGADDAEDGNSGGTGRREQLEKARTGINLVYIGSCLLLASLATALFAILTGRIVAVCGAVAAGGVVAMVLAVLAGLLGLASAVVAIIGQIFCCYAPPRHSASLLAVLSLVCAGAAVLAGLVYVPLASMSESAVALPLFCVALGLGLAFSFLFLFFLRALALAVQAKWVALSLRNLIIAAGASLVIYAFLVVIVKTITGSPIALEAFSIRPQAETNSGLAGTGVGWLVVAVIGFGLMLTLFVWFERSLQELKDNLDTKLGQRPMFGMPAWVPLTGSVGALFFVYLVFLFIVFMIGTTSAPEKPKEAEPTTQPGQMPLYRQALPLPWN